MNPNKVNQLSSVAEDTEQCQSRTNIVVKPVWLDCDPGHDDAFAILLAAYHPYLKLIGISTVVGNQTIDRTTANVYKVLHLANIKNIPVIQGCSEPLCQPISTCPEIHGQTGMDGADIPEAPQKHNVEDDENYLWKIYRLIVDNGSRITLMATGQLTNVALLLKVFPKVKNYIEEIVIMGGCIGLGNMSPAAEFNILNDPEAAHIVFSSNVRLVMVPLEVTHTVCVTPDISQRLDLINSRFSTILNHLLHFFASTYSVKNIF
ncbi:unnamed protein product [Didymodactylos carnosus]|uniref:Inosine/uridine-preferring nucleoside hydrolase domain-containing protein n=1 Tax=Didymodactylos carnosus TaxID=1234261 RepID=A0A815WKE0_9BILA|nr:unnamed protein product [Didymodactylos carnosus]CAF4402436.1 unnamed protein product [Didymodactylos carnosus]